MPDQKNIPDSPGNTTDLSELISSAKKNLENKKTPETRADVPENAAVQSAAADKSHLPDISFRKSEGAPAGGEIKSASPDKPDGYAGRSSRQNMSQREQNTLKSQNRTNQNREKPPANGASSSARRSAGKVPQGNVRRSASAPANNSGSLAKKPIQEKNPARTVPAAAAASAVSAQEEEGGGLVGSVMRKFKFTKKQALSIIGLIASLILLLILVIVLIFNHYYGLLNTDGQKINNSDAMVYSDVDYSLPDTLDKDAEENKLKELIADSEKISDEAVMNILLIGEDIRDTATGGAGNTDVMMIISVNTDLKTITLTSVMRDCYVWIPGWYSTRINAAYYHGGEELLEETIEEYMGIEIDRYVLVNFESFIEIVDTIGGLDIYVTDDEANGYEWADPNGENTRGMQNPLDEQNKYLGNPVGTDYLESGGYLHLNGNQALAYARLRYVGDSDYERTQRQRTVITEMIKKSREMSVLEMDSLLTSILPQITTNITKSEAAGLLIDMLDFRDYEIQQMRVPADGTFTDENIDGMAVLSVDFTANARIFYELVYEGISQDSEDEDESGDTDY